MFRGFRPSLLCLLLVWIAHTRVTAQVERRAEALALEQQGRNAEAEVAWQSIAAAYPKSPQAFAHLGLIQAREARYASAIENYDRALAIAPTMPGLQMNLGLACFKANRYAEAIKAFSAELRLHPPGSPESQRLITLLGMTHYGMGDYFVAIPFLQRAAEQEPQSLALRLTLAHSCLWSKQYECVLSVYKEILALNAESAEADMLAGEALDEKGDDAGATEQFRAAAKADPKEPTVHFGLGYLLWKQHHFAEAASEFRAELDNDPSQQQARAYLGDSLVESNAYDQAEAELQKAATAAAGSPALGMVHRDLGIVYAEAGRKDEAAEELRKAISLDPQDVSPHWRLAKLLQSMGKREEAKEEFAIASAMNRASSRPLTQEIDQRPAPGP